MNKKILSLVLALIMVFSLFTPAFAADEETEKTDAVEAAVETAPVTEEFIEFLKEHKIIMGDAKGDLMLDKEIDRASFAALLARMDNKEDAAKAVQALPSRFKDMSPADWANGYANLVADQGWMKGNEKGEFMPRKNISYAEIATTLVRFLGTDTAGFVYPTSFIAKGFELGLWDGVRKIENYNQPAIRKDIFRMVYNAISREDFGRYTVYKMIVLENSRVAQLGANEIKAEILDVVQMPNKVSERGIGKVGEQIKFNIEGLKLDTEFLLGKVANFSIDENGKLVKVVIDETYDYVWGEFRANEKNFVIARRNYGVRVDERYWKIDGQRYDNDDRMYRTYVTSGYRAANFHYIDFVKQIKDEKIAPSMARVTAKDGMVIFIDAFQYKDIAPVKEVARDGKDVYFYNDARDGAVEVMRPSSRVIGYSEKEGFHNMKASDIKANDVIHWMTGFTLVRRDAEVTGKLEKTYRSLDGEFAVIGENDYFLNSKNSNVDHPFQSVYAYDNTNFRALQDRAQINDMRGDDVIVLLDVMGEVQLITSHRKYTDNVALITKVGSAWGQSFHAPNKEENFTLKDDPISNYGVLKDHYKLRDAGEKACYDLTNLKYKDYVWNGTRTQRFDQFNYADLVYVQAEEEKIATSAVMVTFDQYDKCMKRARFDKLNYAYINVNKESYRFTPETDVFVYNIYDYKGVPQIVLGKMDINEVIKYNKNNKKLQAYVVTEKEYRHFIEEVVDINTYNRISDRSDIARIIIFKNVDGAELELGPIEYAKVWMIHERSTGLRLETSKGQMEDIDFVNYRNHDLNALEIGPCGDFIQFRRVMSEDGSTNKAFFIKKMNTESAVIDKKFSDGFTTKSGRRIYTGRYTKEFGDSMYSNVRIITVKGNDAEVVDYHRIPCGYACNLTPAQEEAKRQLILAAAALKCSGMNCQAPRPLVDRAIAIRDKFNLANLPDCAYNDRELADALARIHEQEIIHGIISGLKDTFNKEYNAANKIYEKYESDLTKAPYEALQDMVAKANLALATYNLMNSKEQGEVATEKTRLDDIAKAAQNRINEIDKERLSKQLDNIKEKAAEVKKTVDEDYNQLTTEGKAFIKYRYDKVTEVADKIANLTGTDAKSYEKAIEEANKLYEELKENESNFDEALVEAEQL